MEEAWFNNNGRLKYPESTHTKLSIRKAGTNNPMAITKDATLEATISTVVPVRGCESQIGGGKGMGETGGLQAAKVKRNPTVVDPM